MISLSTCATHPRGLHFHTLDQPFVEGIQLSTSEQSAIEHKQRAIRKLIDLFFGPTLPLHPRVYFEGRLALLRVASDLFTSSETACWSSVLEKVEIVGHITAAIERVNSIEVGSGAQVDLQEFVRKRTGADQTSLTTTQMWLEAVARSSRQIFEVAIPGESAVKIEVPPIQRIMGLVSGDAPTPAPLPPAEVPVTVLGAFKVVRTLSGKVFAIDRGKLRLRPGDAFWVDRCDMRNPRRAKVRLSTASGTP